MKVAVNKTQDLLVQNAILTIIELQAQKQLVLNVLALIIILIMKPMNSVRTALYIGSLN